MRHLSAAIPQARNITTTLFSKMHCFLSGECSAAMPSGCARYQVDSEANNACYFTTQNKKLVYIPTKPDTILGKRNYLCGNTRHAPDPSPNLRPSWHPWAQKTASHCWAAMGASHPGCVSFFSWKQVFTFSIPGLKKTCNLDNTSISFSDLPCEQEEFDLF